MISFDLLSPKELNRDEWCEIQVLQRDAFIDGLPQRSTKEIDHLTAWAEPDRFYESHVSPNSEVGKQFNDNQSFANPRVAILEDNNDVVGFGYVANNVSGKSQVERAAKLLGTAKRYLWLRELAVHPDYQRHGFATHLARMLLMSGSPFQPATTYIWPDEIPFLATPLRKAGFGPTDEQPVKIYGPESEPVRQVRMLSRSVGKSVLSL